MKRKSERVMPKGEQVRRIAKLLATRGVHFSKSEMGDLVDPTLHYDENKRDVLKHYRAKKEHRIADKDFILDQARAVHAARSARAQIQDHNIKARRTFTIEQLAKDDRKAALWFSAPNRYDIKGIDYGKVKLAMPKGDRLPKVKPKKKPEKTLYERLAELPF